MLPTYGNEHILILLFKCNINSKDPFINAIIPLLAFVVLTLTVPIVKKSGLRRCVSYNPLHLANVNISC